MPSPLFLSMLKNWRWTPAATRSGAARRARGWRPGLAPMALRRLAAMTCPSLKQSSCSTQGWASIPPSDPPTYACVEEQDGIASWRVMKARLDALSAFGIDTEIHVYEGLGHGFGLGTGTSAEGWIDDAIAFWSRQMD